MSVGGGGAGVSIDKRNFGGHNGFMAEVWLHTNRRAILVEARPELVVEVALDGVQRSSRYPGGVALRFARVRRYRSDKAATDADTIDDVRAMLAGEGMGTQPSPPGGDAPGLV